ncbi:hypothetical protein BD309DRAFT_210784 [Dichomitus squalens]|uniref:Uncharacterized protein n=1 Tax=Dichomitus squalens TaxID=114155 RepID=A0A4Q9PNY9_9APHY|nr:hypothetical protein BD309DRAFT_210784 [Dichomitus squalens]TBU56011.1 hypothetical protein BD310DRAFT_644888 [Dichomitus squalens]
MALPSRGQRLFPIRPSHAGFRRYGHHVDVILGKTRRESALSPGGRATPPKATTYPGAGSCGAASTRRVRRDPSPHQTSSWETAHYVLGRYVVHCTHLPPYLASVIEFELRTRV